MQTGPDAAGPQGGGEPRTARRPHRPDRDSVDHALIQLRRRIVRGEIAPGTELSQVSLAQALGVSTTPLREALRQLEAEGLVESRRNRRPRVPPFDPDDLDSVYCNRVLLESLSVALSVPALTAEDLAALRGHLDTMAELADDSDDTAWEAAHAAFHRGLVAECGEPLRNQVNVLLNRSERYRRMSVLGNEPASRAGGVGAQEHEAIFAACAAREPHEAALLLARHLTRSALALLAQLAPDVDPVAVRTALHMVMSWCAQAGSREALSSAATPIEASR
jgi:DNA-binding GntR family transcriptional regulator